MKPMPRFFLLATAGMCAVLPFRVSAQEWQNRFYCKFDAGASWLESTEVKDFFGPVPSDTRVDFDVGPRFGITLGYNITDWFAAELDTGFMDNPVRSLTGATDVEASVYTVPFMGNVRFQLPNRSRFTPYIGAGAGANSSVFDVSHIQYFGTYFSGSASDVVFAFQAIAGFRVAINQHLGLGLEYHFIHSEAPTYEVNYGTAFNIYSDHVAFGEMNMHVAAVRFDITF